MAESSSSNTSGGISFLGMLAVAFITLKLCGIISWSWWWVLLPLYGPLAILILLIGFLLILGLFTAPKRRTRW